jgi:hypothetical protein
MTTYTLPLVGAHFRPPAKALLAVLPAGQALRLRPEPSNEYDANACQVIVDTADIPESCHDDLASEAPPYGYDLEGIFAADEWHLGYIPRTDAETITPLINQWILDNDTDNEPLPVPGAVPAVLSFLPSGKPAVTFEV